MKTLLRKYLLGIVAAAFTLLALLPHHHHDGEGVCMTVKVCHKDGRINDEHTDRCRDVRLDKHQLYAPAAHKQKVLATVWTDGNSGGAFLSPDFWNEEKEGYDVHTLENISYYNGNNALPRHDGRHWNRRGPPCLY